MSLRHMPTPSLVIWRLQYRITSLTLTVKAYSYAYWLESGNIPENPPCATTRGALPKQKKKKELITREIISQSIKELNMIYQNQLNLKKITS
jgi:hypothetical protein